MLKKSIRRQLPQSLDRRQWSITLHPWGIEFRPLRSRDTFSITWETIFHRAMEIAAEHARKEKALARAIARRKER